MIPIKLVNEDISTFSEKKARELVLILYHLHTIYKTK
ncbi:hypothetical protein J2S11_002496 [Bacillus horti]|uniref:Uncharacterized protein n=1 Tax=Caldalkalibacillus horti TaxID=77523 RepID=A0ABT9W0M3_9BACI|nr:hypothetical protein [Bacillus horti]